MAQSSSVLIIGIGNAQQGDDDAGPAAARLLRRRLGGVRIIDQIDTSAALIETWEDARAVFLITALAPSETPGTIHRFDAGEEPLPASMLRPSNSELGIAEAIERARVQGQLPARLIVYGIEGQCFAPNTSLSPTLTHALPDLCTLVQREVASVLQAAEPELEKHVSSAQSSLSSTSRERPPSGGPT